MAPVSDAPVDLCFFLPYGGCFINPEGDVKTIYISIADPPEGFVQKTAYFSGYQIIKACVDQEIKLEEICLLDSEYVIDKSGYFK